jgi:hypothetical protein
MPEGTQFSGQLQLNVLSNVTSGDLGYGPIDKTEYTFAIRKLIISKMEIELIF